MVKRDTKYHLKPHSEAEFYGGYYMNISKLINPKFTVEIDTFLRTIIWLNENESWCIQGLSISKVESFVVYDEYDYGQPYTIHRFTDTKKFTSKYQLKKWIKKNFK